MAFLQTVLPRDPFWAWVVGFNPGKWSVVLGRRVEEFEGPGLSPPYKGPNKVGIDEGRLGIYQSDGQRIWFPAGSWALAGYALIKVMPAPVTADILTAEMARHMADEQLEINFLKTCYTPQGPAEFERVWADFLKLRPLSPEPPPEDIGVATPVRPPTEDDL